MINMGVWHNNEDRGETVPQVSEEVADDVSCAELDLDRDDFSRNEMETDNIREAKFIHHFEASGDKLRANKLLELNVLSALVGPVKRSRILR